MAQRRIPRTLPWVRQPQGIVGVEWANPMSRGLTHLFNPAGLYNAVDGSPLTGSAGVPTITTGTDGLAITSGGILGSFSQAMPAAVLNAGNPWTLATVFELRPDISTASQYDVWHSQNIAAYGVFDRALGFTLNTGKLYAVGYIYDGASKVIAGSTGLAYTTGRIYCTVVLSSGAGFMNLYVNGKQDVAPIAVSNNGYTGYSGTVYLNAGGQDANYRMLSVVRVGGYAWGAREAAAFDANRWALYRQNSAPIFTTASGLLLPTLSSVTYTPGTLTSSGYGVRVTAA